MGSLVSGYCSLLFLLSFLVPTARSGDAEALLALKSAVDPLDSLPWREGNAGAVCSWAGVRDCVDGRVTKLVLESLNLTGSLDGKTLNRLDQLRVLSLKDNSISGDVPDLSGLVNLKSLYLNGNALSGGFPSSLTGLHRLKILVLAGNRISGEIPVSVLNLRRLYVFYLQDNGFTGGIPPLNQTSLRFLNVSNNRLSGEIPATPALSRFNASSFSGNVDLCGSPLGGPCNGTVSGGPSLSPAYPENPAAKKSRSNRSRLIKIVAGTVGGFALLLICLLLLCSICRSRGQRKEKAPG